MLKGKEVSEVPCNFFVLLFNSTFAISLPFSLIESPFWLRMSHSGGKRKMFLRFCRCTHTRRLSHTSHLTIGFRSPSNLIPVMFYQQKFKIFGDTRFMGTIRSGNNANKTIDPPSRHMRAVQFCEHNVRMGLKRLKKRLDVEFNRRNKFLANPKILRIIIISTHLSDILCWA